MLIIAQFSCVFNILHVHVRVLHLLYMHIEGIVCKSYIVNYPYLCDCGLAHAIGTIHGVYWTYISLHITISFKHVQCIVRANIMYYEVFNSCVYTLLSCSHPTQAGLMSARKLCESLIETVKKDYEMFKASQSAPLGFGSAPGYGPPPG